MLKEIYQLIAKLKRGEDQTLSIKSIQRYVYDDENFLKLDEKVKDILSEFAHDLDFYEPDPNKRKEDPAYYDESKLNEEIEAVIKKLNSLGFNGSPST